MKTYSCKLSASEYTDDLKKILLWEQKAFNEASKIQFKLPKNSIVDLHKKFYKKFRKKYPDIPSQVVIRAEQAVLSVYRSIKSNKQKIKSPPIKNRLSIRLDKRIYSKPSKDSIRLTTGSGRKLFQFKPYPKIQELLDKYTYKDPLLFIRNGDVYISLTFDIPVKPAKNTKVLGVDVGIRVAAACSDGRLIIDKKFNKEKRTLRYKKRMLNSAAAKGSSSAKKSLKRLSKKERNKNKNQTHLVANEILKTDCSTIAVENLKGIKHKRRNKKSNKLSQVPFYMLRQFLTYKAQHMGKTVVAVSPANTSLTDSVTGKKKGERKGRRFYAESGLIYDADINAAINIAKKTKLPVSQDNLLDGQAIVNKP